MEKGRNTQVAGHKSLSTNHRLRAKQIEGSRTVPRRIELHIGELTLHGFDHVDPNQLGSTVRHELSRLLAEQGIPSSLEDPASLTHLEGEAFHIDAGANSDIIGARIARAIYRGLER
jgi:hypothetical protein